MNEGDYAFNWRDAFKWSEDSLTSSIFSLLFYLPVDVFWPLFYRACYHPSIPQDCGELLSYEFWPHWNCQGTRNTNYIEPDVFIRFEKFDLIIEAKRADYVQQQNPSQWEEQILGYRNEFNKLQTKELFYVALSGIAIGNEKQAELQSIPITTCRWTRILHEINSLLLKRDALDKNIVNVLKDLVIAFSLHDFRTRALLDSLPSKYNILHQQATDLNLRINFPKIRGLNLIDFPDSIRNIKDINNLM